MDLKLRKMFRISSIVLCICLLILSFVSLAIADMNEGTYISSGTLQDGVYVASDSGYIGRDAAAIEQFTQLANIFMVLSAISGIGFICTLFIPKPKELI